MAIVKKGSKVSKPGFPSEFVSLVTRAATAQTYKACFESVFDGVKGEIEGYLTAEDCPVTINVGEKGANPKIEGVGTVIVSQPERLDNKAAAAVIADLVAEGKINAADLTALISSVNKEALSKVVDAETLKGLVKTDDSGDVKLQISVRTDGSFKADVSSRFESEVLPMLLKA